MHIKTFEEACAALKIGTELPDVSSWPAEMQGAMIAEYKLMVIAKALNDGWYPNWADSNEPKYWPWFDREGDGFSFVYVDDYYQSSSVSSRLCFKNREIARYAATEFIDLYKEYMS